MKAKHLAIAGYFACVWLCFFTETLSASSCARESLPCDDGSCVERGNWCDHFEECPDVSDEKYCKTRSFFNAYTADPNKCKETHFLCQDGRCFPAVVKCDGVEDCHDGYDEKECGARSNDEHESRTRDTEQPEIPGRYPEPQPSAVEERQTSTATYRHTEPPPTPEERKPSPTSHRRHDPQPRPEQRQTWEERHSHTYQRPASQDRDVPTEAVPDRQSVHHRTSPRPEVRTMATVYDVPLQVPRPIIRRLLLPTLSRPTSESLRMAREWLIENRDDNFGWGKDTSRALVALSLSEHGYFFYERTDTSRMKKQLQVLLAVERIRKNSEDMRLTKLSLYINALLASCQNPRDFHGWDLVNELRSRTTLANTQRERGENFFTNPIIYLTLCLVDETSEEDVHNLRELLYRRTNEQKFLDMQAISITACSCIAKIPRFAATCKQLLKDTANNLISRMRGDGNFGSVYSTALAVQALLSAGSPNRWNSELSIDFLKSKQSPEGSFGDLLATYYVLPVLARKSLADLKDVLCNRTGTHDGLSVASLGNSRKPMHYVRYSLYFGDPVQMTNSKTLRVPVNSTFFDIMRLAAELDPKFRFQQEQEGQDITVYSISNVPNDAERGFYWQLYLDPNSPVPFEDGFHLSNLLTYSRGVQDLIPSAGDHVVFWYRRS